MGNKGSKSKEPRRDGKEHTAPSTSATGQVVSPTETTVKKQFVTTEPNKVDDHGGQIPAGASGESRLHSSPNISPATSTAGGSSPRTQLVASCVSSGVSSIIAQCSGITQEPTRISSAHRTPGGKIKGIGTVDVMSATISPLLGDSRDGEGSQSSTLFPNVRKSDIAQKIALSSSTAVCQDGNIMSFSNTTQQTVSSTKLAMKANVEGASNMVDRNILSPLVVNDSLEPASGGGHTQPDKSSTDSTKPSPSTGTSAGGVSEEQDMEGSGINPYSTHHCRTCVAQLHTCRTVAMCIIIMLCSINLTHTCACSVLGTSDECRHSIPSLLLYYCILLIVAVNEIE